MSEQIAAARALVQAADALLDYDHPDNDVFRHVLGLGPRDGAIH